MEKLKTTEKLINYIVNRYQRFYRIIVVLLAISIIAAIFPRNNFKYDFVEGKPWQYEDLIAPYAFPIVKSKDQLSNERNKILKNFIPYYTKDSELLSDKKSNFIISFSILFNEFSRDSIQSLRAKDSIKQQNTGLQVLDLWFEKGIIEPKNFPHDTFDQEKVNLLDGNEIEIRPVNDFFNSLTAFNHLLQEFNSDPSINDELLMPLLKQYIESDIVFDSTTSFKLLNVELDNILPFRDKVQVGERIIGNGQVIDQEAYQKLVSLENTYKDQRQGYYSETLTYVGYFIICSLLFGLFLYFTYLLSPKVFRNLRHLTFVLIIIGFFLFLVRSANNFEAANILYAIPFCIIPIIIRTFINDLVAFFVFTLILLLCTFLVSGQSEFLILEFIACTTALLTNIKTAKWSQIFSTVGIIFLTYCLTYLGLHLLVSGEITDINYQISGPFFLSSLLTLVAYPLIPMLERVFGFVSNLSLSELNDVNHPLLENLSNKAPGSFWHSIQVSSLAEKVAVEIGANEMLAKVGALYHDVGKAENPIYFIENQNIEINPHDDLDSLESVQIILGHVTKGVEIAKKHRLPGIIVDFIRTHHGTTRVEYFYRKYCEQFPDENIDEKLFRYPGPTPYSKETAIVMLADSIEAASMSLKNPDKEQIDKLVESIIQDKIKNDQFENCDLSFKDIKIISKTFKKLLKSKFHIRISY